MVHDITHDIKALDQSKKNLTTSITLLKRLQMIGIKNLLLHFPLNTCSNRYRTIETPNPTKAIPRNPSTPPSHPPTPLPFPILQKHPWNLPIVCWRPTNPKYIKNPNIQTFPMHLSGPLFVANLNHYMTPVSFLKREMNCWDGMYHYNLKSIKKRSNRIWRLVD